MDTMLVVDYGKGVKQVFFYKETDYDPSPDMTGSYNHESSIMCPACEGYKTCCVLYETEVDNETCDNKITCWYCKDCYLVFKCFWED